MLTGLRKRDDVASQRLTNRIIKVEGGAARRQRVTRNGRDFTHRFALIVDALASLRSRSCIIDGEAVACGDNGVPSFDRIRYRRHDGSVFLYAFDLIELNGDDLRREPLEVRKATLASVLAEAAAGLRLNEHLEITTVRSCLPTRAAWA